MATKRQQTKDRLNSSAIDAQFDGPAQREDVKAEKRPKDRITLRLYLDTLALMDALKIDARKHGRGVTYGDVVEEAIQDLAEKYHINV